MKKKVYTLAELEEMNQAFKQRIADARAEIAQNRQDISNVESKMEIATENGDIPQYKALYVKRNDLEVNIAAVTAIVEKAIEKHSAGFNDDDVCEAWAAVVSEYNAKAAKDAAEYEAQQRALFNKYVEMARRQNEVLHMRGKLSALVSKDGHSGNMYNIPHGFAKVNGVQEPGKALHMNSYSMPDVPELIWNSLNSVCGAISEGNDF